MKKKYSALLLNRMDNVVTAVREMSAGEIIQQGVAVKENIPFGYKIALKHIDKNEEVVKYGIPIAKALEDIDAGECVHIHNAVSLSDTRSGGFDEETAAPTDMCYTLLGDK